MSKVASQNECARAGGSWIILPFMCETGGLSVPCVYVLLSLTWCNETCSNNSGGMASQRESVKMLRFAATLCLIWILLEREWLVTTISTVHDTADITYGVQTIKKTLLLPWGFNTWEEALFHYVWLHSKSRSAEVATSSLPRVFSLSEITNTKAPKTLPHFIMMHCSLISEWVWACFLLRIPPLL